jgi:hypothetical protein
MGLKTPCDLESAIASRQLLTSSSETLLNIIDDSEWKIDDSSSDFSVARDLDSTLTNDTECETILNHHEPELKNIKAKISSPENFFAGPESFQYSLSSLPESESPLIFKKKLSLKFKDQNCIRPPRPEPKIFAADSSKYLIFDLDQRFLIGIRETLKIHSLVAHLQLNLWY